jgi:hypothetical protein
MPPKLQEWGPVMQAAVAAGQVRLDKADASRWFCVPCNTWKSSQSPYSDVSYRRHLPVHASGSSKVRQPYSGTKLAAALRKPFIVGIVRDAAASASRSRPAIFVSGL